MNRHKYLEKKSLTLGIKLDHLQPNQNIAKQITEAITTINHHDKVSKNMSQEDNIIQALNKGYEITTAEDMSQDNVRTADERYGYKFYIYYANNLASNMPIWEALSYIKNKSANSYIAFIKSYIEQNREYVKNENLDRLFELFQGDEVMFAYAYADKRDYPINLPLSNVLSYIHNKGQDIYENFMVSYLQYRMKKSFALEDRLQELDQIISSEKWFIQNTTNVHRLYKILMRKKDIIGTNKYGDIQYTSHIKEFLLLKILLNLSEQDWDNIIIPIIFGHNTKRLRNKYHAKLKEYDSNIGLSREYSNEEHNVNSGAYQKFHQQERVSLFQSIL